MERNELHSLFLLLATNKDFYVYRNHFCYNFQLTLTLFFQLQMVTFLPLSSMVLFLVILQPERRKCKIN